MNHFSQENGPSPLESRFMQVQSLSLHDILFCIRKWKWEFLLVTITTVLATLLYIMLFRDPVFVSEARLFIRVSQEQTAPRTLMMQEGTMLLTPATSDVTSEIDLFLNSDLADEVIRIAGLLDAVAEPPPQPETLVEHLRATVMTVSDSLREMTNTVAYALGIKVRLSPREALIREIRSSLGIENSRGSNVVIVSMRWPDPDVPRILLQHYLDSFLQFRLDAFRGGDAPYFERQTETARTQVQELETRIASLRSATGIEDVDAQRSLLINSHEEGLRHLRETQQTLAQIRSRIIALEARGDDGDPLVLADLPDNPILRLLDERSIALYEERLRLQAQPSLDGTDLAALNHALRALTRSTLQTIRDYEERFVEFQADAQAILGGLEQRLAALSSHESEWNALQVELSLARQQYEDHARRLSEARRAEDLQLERISNVVVIQQPTEAHLATGTRNVVVLTVGGVFALLLGGSWLVLREALESRVWRPKDLSSVTGLTLLGATRSRWGSPIQDDMALAAASVGSICARRGIRTLAYMAVSHESREPALRCRYLVAGLLSIGFKEVEIINAGRWVEQGTRSDTDGKIHERTIPDAALLNRDAKLAVDTVEAGKLRLIAVPPLFSSVTAMKVAGAVDAILFDVTAGSDELTEIEAAERWIRLNGARSVGMILADVRPYAINASAVSA